MPDSIVFTGDNVAEVQDFVGFMENMDGDVKTNRFSPGNQKYDIDPDDGDVDYLQGEYVWPDRNPHLWVERVHGWVPVIPGETIYRKPGYAGYYNITPYDG